MLVETQWKHRIDAIDSIERGRQSTGNPSTATLAPSARQSGATVDAESASVGREPAEGDCDARTLIKDSLFPAMGNDIQKIANNPIQWLVRIAYERC